MGFELVIVTGLSGSGKSAAVDALEDIGFFCVDNIPPNLLATFLKLAQNAREMKPKVAVVTDCRAGGAEIGTLSHALSQLNAQGYTHKLLFVDAADDTLCRRYKETRRKHPLLERCGNSLEQAIRTERELLLSARQAADYVIDTTQITAAQCKARVRELFAGRKKEGINIRCVSFGFKYGLPGDADLVFDLRCLPNPFYEPELRMQTGLDAPVRDYVLRHEQAKGLVPHLLSLVDYLLPLYREEGKSQLVAALGCTGGKHRSVVFAEILHRHFEAAGFSVNVYHRDILK